MSPPESWLSPAPVTPVLFVDLDGTVRKGVDELGRFVNCAADVEVFPEAHRELARWRAAGGLTVGVTNQGGIALGYASPADIEAGIAETVRQCRGELDLVRYCPHHPAADIAGCTCRKPAPGLLHAGLRALVHAGHDDAHPALMVGDRPEDAGAAAAMGVPFVWAADWRVGAVTLHVRAAATEAAPPYWLDLDAPRASSH